MAAYDSRTQGCEREGAGLITTRHPTRLEELGVFRVVIQLIINGAALGCIYALVALGIVFIYKSVGVINFSQGDFSALAGYLLASFYVTWRLPYSLSFMVTTLIMGGVGIVFERSVYRPLRRMAPLTIAICTVGVSILIQNIIMFVWGGRFINVPSVFGDYLIEIGELVIRPEFPLILIITVLFLFFQQYILYHTSLGKSMRATQSDQEAAELMGIRTRKTISLTFAYSGIVSGMAGMLLAPIFFLSTTMGSMLRLKALTAVVIAGFGSIPGAIIGGLILGLTEVLGASFISSEYKDVITFTVLVLILVFRPQGIFGESVGQKV